MMENDPSDIVDFWSSGCIGQEGRGRPCFGTWAKTVVFKAKTLQPLTDRES